MGFKQKLTVFGMDADVKVNLDYVKVDDLREFDGVNANIIMVRFNVLNYVRFVIWRECCTEKQHWFMMNGGI